jgi:hypothetical protein
MKENSQYSYVLHLDWDYEWPEHWKEAWRQTAKLILEHFNIQIEKIIVKPSPNVKDGHVWIHVKSRKPLTDDQINMLQWLLTDHQTRVWINILRIERGLRKFWNKLFTRHLWVKPLPKRCQKCKILKILKEMREKHHVETHNPHNST